MSYFHQEEELCVSVWERQRCKQFFKLKQKQSDLKFKLFSASYISDQYYNCSQD